MKYTKIKSIKPAGKDTIYHLTVSKNHNFFANNLCVHNCDYTGDVGVILINHGEEEFFVKNGDRIAQLVFVKHETVDFKIVETLEETERGEGGFGHTGKN